MMISRLMKKKIQIRKITLIKILKMTKKNIRTPIARRKMIKMIKQTIMKLIMIRVKMTIKIKVLMKIRTILIQIKKIRHRSQNSQRKNAK